MESNQDSAKSFFTKNLLRGLLSFVLFIVAFIFFRDWILTHYEEWLQPIADQPFVLYCVFFLNELFLGLISPEVFMLFFIPKGAAYFTQQIIIMTILSYCGGFLAFSLGRFFRQFPKLDLFVKMPKLAKWKPYYDKYGGLIIFVAAVTPVPFAFTSLMVAWLGYPISKYLLYGSLRFIRFVLYGYLFWLANSI